MRKMILFCFLAGICFLATPKIHADYAQDEDIRRAAQKLSDEDRAEKADEKRRYDEQHFTDNSSVLGNCVGLIVVIIGGIGIYVFISNLPQKIHKDWRP